MKKFFFFAAAALAAMTVNAQTLIFDADTVSHKATGTWSDGYTWEVGDAFDLTLVDTKAKMVVDANNAYFGTAENHVKLQSRLKTGGKSATSGENSIEIDVYQSGKLNIAARTGSNSATDRNIIITKGGTELVNKILLESDAVEVAGLDSKEPEKKTKVYPIISCDVTPGKLVITYPVGSVNFYAFAIGDIDVTPASEGINNTNATVKVEKFYRDGQLIIRKNGVEYNALGARL